ncbi:MAG TPA: virulence-associated E family protein [Methylocella sp.]
MLEKLRQARPDYQLADMGKHFATCSMFEGCVYDALIMEATEIKMPGGALASIELRWRMPGDAKGKKRITNVFRAYDCDANHMNPVTGERLPFLCDKWSHLHEGGAGLLLPVGADELKKACDGASKGSVAWYLCEGAHSMQGVKQRLDDPAVAPIVEKWKRENAIDKIVVGAWLCGLGGAEHTNFGMRARSDMQVVGQNDWKLDFSEKGPIGRVVIVPDTDKAGYKEKEAVATHLHENFKCSQTKLYEVAAPRDLPNKYKGEDKGWDDLNELPTDVTQEERVKQLLDPLHWEPEPYIRDAKSKRFILNATNVCIHLMRRKELGSLLYYDEFAGYVKIRGPLPGQGPCGPYPRKFGDGDCRALLAYLQRVVDFEKTTKEHIYDGVFAFAENHNRVHPIREHYESLTWDGTPRIEDSFTTYHGAKPTDYTRLVGRYWWIQLVARIYEPGCQADYMLVLIDTQGTLKSSSFKRICISREHFTDNIKDIVDHRKAGFLMRGKQIIEFAEMVALKKAGRDIAKAFITQTEDEYQPPYGHDTIHQQRQCVLVATTNDPHCLHDPTGDRRSWTIVSGVIHPIDLNALERDRDQLLAEAVHCYKNHERYWPTPEEEKLYFKPEQDEHTAEETWKVLLQEALEPFESESENNNGVCVNLGQIIQFLRDRDGKSPRPNAIGPYLRKLGWTNESVRVNGEKTRFWWREDQRAMWLREDVGRPGDLKWEQVKTRHLKWHGGANGSWTLGNPGVDEPITGKDEGGHDAVQPPLHDDDGNPMPPRPGWRPSEPTKH